MLPSFIIVLLDILTFEKLMYHVYVSVAPVSCVYVHASQEICKLRWFIFFLKYLSIL